MILKHSMSDELKYITVSQAANDEGLFAKTDIPAGTVLLKIYGKTISYADTVKLGDKESYCLQIDTDKYIALHFPFFLANHSCSPNCGVTANLEFITLAPVKKGEQLRWDYSTSMLERSWSIPCTCGAPNCRKKIDDFDTLPVAQQQFYIAQGIVMPFILHYLNNVQQA